MELQKWSILEKNISQILRRNNISNPNSNNKANFEKISNQNSNNKANFEKTLKILKKHTRNNVKKQLGKLLKKFNSGF